MNSTKLYHFVLNIERLNLILESGFIYKDTSIIKPCVYMTRNYNYLTIRGIRMIFDYEKLKQNYKIQPFSYKGWCILNKKSFIPQNDEMEERIFNDVNINKYCVRIDIDQNKFPKLNFKHKLINYMIF